MWFSICRLHLRDLLFEDGEGGRIRSMWQQDAKSWCMFLRFIPALCYQKMLNLYSKKKKKAKSILPLTPIKPGTINLSVVSFCLLYCYMPVLDAFSLPMRVIKRLLQSTLLLSLSIWSSIEIMELELLNSTWDDSKDKLCCWYYTQPRGGEWGLTECVISTTIYAWRQV